MSTTNEIFVAEYLKRIGYQGSTEPCLTTLLDLHLCHIYAVPFENLDLLKDGFTPNLDREFLFDKVVRRNRGGVCYELNSLFCHLLSAMGFDVCQVSVAVKPDDSIYSHVTTLIRLPEGDYIADVGFGDTYLPPVKVGTEVTQVGGIDYYLEYTGEQQAEVMRRRPGQESERMYTVILIPCAMSDYFETFRWASAMGNTIFSEYPICVRHTPEQQISLRRQKLIFQHNGQILEQHPVSPGEETDRVLREYFDLP